MKKPRLRAIVPVWAQRIEVEKRGEFLWLKGWGHVPNPVDVRESKPQLDILQRFRYFGLRSIGQKEELAEGAGVYQFADANSDEKLIAFCRDFGPVRAKVRSLVYEEAGYYTVAATQSMKQLREEQKKFAAAVRMVQQINRNGKADRMMLLNAMNDLEIVDSEVLSMLHLLSEGVPANKSTLAKTIDLLPFARLMLCDVLNASAPRLFPLDGEVIELPDTRSDGIYHALYFQLRLDFMAHRTIGTCLNCGNHFAVFRRGSRGCNAGCRRALRNQDYWRDHKTTINRARRIKTTEK